MEDLNDDDLIPCEYCNMYIAHNVYLEHIRTCLPDEVVFPISYFVDMNSSNISIPRSVQQQHLSDEDEEYSDDDDGLDRYITSSSQITGANLRVFLTEHFQQRISSNNRSRTSSPYGTSPNNNTLLTLTIPRSNIVNVYENNVSIGERIGNVEVGIEDIDEVTDKTIEKNDIDKDMICVICQESLELKELKDLRKLKCKHIYCDTCICAWLKNHKKCPICQVDLNDIKKK